MTLSSHGAGATRIRQRAVLLLTAAAIAGSAAGTAQAEGDALRLLTYNIWHRLKQEPEVAAQVLIPGNYDAILLQEENNSTFVRDLPGILQDAGLGSYQGARIGDSGILSRLPGTMGAVRLPGAGGQGHNISYTVTDETAGRPATTVGSVHFDWADTSTKRIAEARAMTDWATSVQGPVIVGGDFNAGDVSERGLHDIDAQIRLLQNAGGNSFYGGLSWEYIGNGDEAQLRRTVQDAYPGQNIDALSWRQWGDALKVAHQEGKDVGLRNETLPVASNTPVTMNILKKDFVLFQTDAIRENFEPHEAGDGSTTWPSYGEDATNTWPSWDRAKIDHFVVSRPYAKWYTLTDDLSDEYLGVVDKQYVVRADGSRIPLSDHELVAHEFTWTGPRLESTDDGSRLVWDADASTFAAQDGVFELTRNNMRTDVYLGQVSDENGIPTLSWLTDAQKKTQLDCGSSDARLAGAIADYCIDDHSFISETLVSNGGTVAVTEDAALGGAAADLRLADGSLRVDGTELKTLDRNVSLEGEGGALNIVEASADVTLAKVVSGSGNLSKRGDGTLRLDAQNTYTGDTTVEAGTMLVNGSIAASGVTAVLGGASLGGNGVVGNLVLSDNGTLLPGDAGIGSLLIEGDFLLGGALLELEIGEDGFDSIHVAGDFDAFSDYTISFSFLDGFLPEKGDFFEFLTVDGAFDSVLDFANLLLPANGLYQGLDIFGDNGGSFALAWTDPYAVADVPLPIPAVMLLSALGLLGRFRRRS